MAKINLMVFLFYAVLLRALILTILGYCVGLVTFLTHNRWLSWLSYFIVFSYMSRATMKEYLEK